MGKVYRVSGGDSVASVAEATGHFAGAIWSHPENAALRARRGNMNILAEGDELFIPDLDIKSVPAATDRVHRFRRRGVPAVFRLQLLRDGMPRRNLHYRLEIEGATIEGFTDERGVLEAYVPPSTREIRLFLDKARTARVLRIGGLEPVDSVAGVQQRLRNLGHDCPLSGSLDEPTRTALRAFQRHAGVTASGEPDADTQAALRRGHDEMGGAR